ncbi:MAG: transcriptional initiation protein Tat [Alcanivoracaceae bacterium]
MTQNRDIPPALLGGLEPLSRRSLLRLTAVSGLALTTGCARMFGRRDAPEALEYVNLTREELRVLTKFTRAVLPTQRHGLPDCITEIPTLKNMDTMVGNMAPTQRELLALGLWVYEYRPMASFKFSRFSSLSDERAHAYVVALQEGNFVERGLTTTLKAVVTLNYWRDPRTWEALDYWGAVTERWGVRRLGNAPLPMA